MATVQPPGLADFLETLTFDPPCKDAQVPIVARMAVHCRDASGRAWTDPAITVFQDATTKLTLAGVERYVIRRLQAIDHVATPEIVRSLVACTVGFAVSGRERAAFLDDLLGKPREVDVSHCVGRFQAHTEQYRLHELRESALARVAKTCAGFCQEAIRRLEAGNNNEAALYATVALEHLFSTRQNTAASVASRTAVVSHLRLGAGDFSMTEGEVKALYDARSRFVHAGTPCSAVDAARLLEYSREVTRSLLVLRMNPANRHPDFLDHWVKNLDWIVSGIRAGKVFENSLLSENGIFGP